jgi:cytidylate kinase
MIITLDGPAGSGKSTVAKLLAEELSFYQIDSGAFYRWITHLAMVYSNKVNNQSLSETVKSDAFKKHLESQTPDINFENGKQCIYYDGENMEKYIRLPAITQNIKVIADEPYVRNFVNHLIQEISRRFSIIADGRDMGTVVFPRADLKFFLDASLDIRAKRRFSEFKAFNPGISLEEVKQQIAQRDKEDQNRKFGQLKAAKDAIFVDTTNLEINAVVQTIIKTIQTKYPDI